ncbi:MAG: T9SS type A sorting domain-containing protein [Bacteroidia bacterium]|nr:T9SS type A sorting domain-containing protein [Bacteroidia bacterium]
MKQVIFFLFVLGLGSQSYAQFEARYWIFGRPTQAQPVNAGIDFFPGGMIYTNSSNPLPTVVPLALSNSNTPVNISIDSGVEGWAVATDPLNGQLLFYTDGVDLYDSGHNVVNKGFRLGGNISSSQAVVICPRPKISSFYPLGDSYFIFVNPSGVDASGIGSGPITYWEYNPSNGSLIGPDSLPGNYKSQDVGEGMLIVPHPDEDKYWLITRLRTPDISTTKYPIYLIDQFGIGLHQAPDLSPAIPTNSSKRVPISNLAFRKVEGGKGYICFSFSRNTAVNLQNSLLISSFDAENGSLDINPKLIQLGNQDILYDIEFSPNGKYIYYSTFLNLRLYQIEWQLANPSPMLIKSYGGIRGGGLKLAADGFIYHIGHGLDFQQRGYMRIGRIIYPDTAISALSTPGQIYQDSVISIPNVFSYNFPEFLPAARLGTSKQELSGSLTDKLRIYSSNNQTVIEWDDDFQVDRMELFSIEGRLLIQKERALKNRLLLSQARGMYILRIQSGREIMTRKLMLKD